MALALAQRARAAPRRCSPTPATSSARAPGRTSFVGLDGALVTPPLASGCLAGVTRALLLEALAAAGTPAAEATVPMSRLDEVTEAFLVSTGRHVQPIRRLDGRALPGCPGPATSPGGAGLARGLRPGRRSLRRRGCRRGGSSGAAGDVRTGRRWTTSPTVTVVCDAVVADQDQRSRRASRSTAVPDQLVSRDARTRTRRPSVTQPLAVPGHERLAGRGVGQGGREAPEATEQLHDQLGRGRPSRPAGRPRSTVAASSGGKPTSAQATLSPIPTTTASPPAPATSSASIPPSFRSAPSSPASARPGRSAT